MKCYLLSRDLMFSSQANGAAGQAGFETQTIGDVEGVVNTEPSVTILDLTMPGLDIAAVVRDLSERGTKIIAVGPHVQGEKLEAAQTAGADLVLTKGQAHRELASVLKKLAAS